MSDTPHVICPLCQTPVFPVREELDGRGWYHWEMSCPECEANLSQIIFETRLINPRHIPALRRAAERRERREARTSA